MTPEERKAAESKDWAEWQAELDAADPHRWKIDDDNYFDGVQGPYYR